MGDKGLATGAGAVLGGPLGAGVGYLASQKGGGGEQIQPGLPPFLAPIWNQASDMIQSLKGLKLDPSIYNMTPMQGQIQGQASNILGGMVPGMSNYVSSVLNPAFANPMSNPNMQAALSAAQNQFTQGLSSATDVLGSQFGMAGQVPQHSGAFGQQATNLATRALGDYGNNVNSLLMNQYNQSIAQQMQALSQGGNVASILGSLSPIAGLPQQLASEKQQGQLSLDQLPFNMILGLLGQTPVSYPSFAPQTPSGLDQLAEILGGLGKFGQGAGAIMAA